MGWLIGGLLTFILLVFALCLYLSRHDVDSTGD
jgi:hypothetical protein